MEILRACQNKAIENFDNHFYNNKNNKGIISMCCGSGKSRVMYEIIKNCQNKKENIFIIATIRVNLIYQLFEDINKWNIMDNKSFVIKLIGGSGSNHKKDTLENNIYDIIKNIVSTNPIIIITTYQSSNKIVDAIKGNKELFPNLIILDESHNTTGDNNKKNRILIKQDDDENYIFTASKYLFMTATPVQLQSKNKNNPYITEATSYTMNNENIYGKIIYEYSFYEGIQDKILVPFSTIYYTTKDEIPNDIKLKVMKMDKPGKQSFYFETISELLLNNIKKYKLKHILVYLQNKDKIKIMQEKLENIINNKLNINIYSITSSNSQKEQNNVLEEFRTPSNFSNILLSVSIFDEGVDEPCIDAIMFGEERYTEARIVQNIGRCLRLNYNKTQSYVIIPNIVYEYNINSTNTSIGAYSSHYKKIREIISILNNSYKNKFYMKSCKIIKNLNTNNLDEDSNDYDKIDQADQYILENNISDNYESIIESDIKLTEWFIQVCTNNNINNESLKNIKTKMIEYNINSVHEYGTIFINTPYHLLHTEFKSEWISWSHILYDTVYSYEEAKEFIKSLDKKFNDSIEWNAYYYDILHNELNDISNDISNDIFNNIIKIPNRVKEYYESKWIDWNDFLNSNNINTLVVITNNSMTNNSDKNMKILINKDSDKIKFTVGEFNSIDLTTDVTPIKNYIKKELGFNCKLIPRILVNFNSIYDRICINCYRIINPIKQPLIVIWPELKKFCYDSNLLNNDIMSITRNTERYIQDIDIIKLCDLLVKEAKSIVNI